MKKFLCLTFIMAFSLNVFAQQDSSDEKIVTTKFSFLTGQATVANHYFSNQEYSNGLLFGAAVDLGSFYRRNQNLSWDLDLSYVGSDAKSSNAPTNPAGTASLGVCDIEVEYATAYNWNLIKNLYLKAGGAFNINGGFFSAPSSINNVFDFLMQPQLKAVGAIKYGWSFKKMNLNLFADLGIPFMGLAMVGSRYEGTKESINTLISNNLSRPSIAHLMFTSFHNLQGLDLNIGVDMEFKHFSLMASIDTRNRWWHAYDVQCYKKYTLFNLGIAVDLVSRSRLSSNNRYF